MPPTIVIAAGGTAGHVVPALAVADALRAERRATSSSSAASAPRRAGAGGRLRAAPIAVEGLSPHQPAEGRARRGASAATALRTARQILRELRPDAVMGGGGYVAGPVGAAAAARGIPLVLTEADSHLGLTNRLLARVRAARLPGVPARRARGRALPRDRAAGAAAGRPTATAARARFGLARGGDLRAGLRRLARRALDQRGGDRGVRATRRSACCTPAGERDYEALARAGAAAPALRPARLHHAVRRRARRRRPRGRARRRLDLRGRRARPAGDPRALSARRRRPPDRQRALDGRRRRGGRRPRRRADGRAPAATRSARCSATRARLAAMARGVARRWRGPDAARDIAREVLAAGGVRGRDG